MSISFLKTDICELLPKYRFLLTETGKASLTLLVKLRENKHSHISLIAAVVV